jgi:hypothetical protein
VSFCGQIAGRSQQASEKYPQAETEKTERTGSVACPVKIILKEYEACYETNAQGSIT